MASTTEPRADERSAMERLIDAERAWREQLDAARAEAERMTATARDETQRADAAFEAMLPSLVEARRQELTRAIAEEAARVRDELLRRAARYEAIDEIALRRLAERLAARIPWLSHARAAAEVAA